MREPYGVHRGMWIDLESWQKTNLIQSSYQVLLYSLYNDDHTGSQ